MCVGLSLPSDARLWELGAGGTHWVRVPCCGQRGVYVASFQCSLKVNDPTVEHISKGGLGGGGKAHAIAPPACSGACTGSKFGSWIRKSELAERHGAAHEETAQKPRKSAALLTWR
ncbi:hypothetical protein NDU88_000294 [Pleurodeles waltl]|uniref:Uncharacterized protein n=1 Tax=Pleurodeles waltl TaxID=8319 RepID=A0AAV7S5M3_PLEWA|nr:hypothetical protein NDU88_000294 [Pleurodeles waltl]